MIRKYMFFVQQEFLPQALLSAQRLMFGLVESPLQCILVILV